MAGCGCGGSKSAIQFQVKYQDGTTEIFNTTTEAQAAIRAHKGGTFKAIPRRTT